MKLPNFHIVFISICGRCAQYFYKGPGVHGLRDVRPLDLHSVLLFFECTESHDCADQPVLVYGVREISGPPVRKVFLGKIAYTMRIQHI